MEKFWMAPAGLHIEPAEQRDAEPIARLHASSFYRGWPRDEFSAYLADPERTPAYIACDAKRKIFGFMMLRHAAEEVELLTIAVDPKRRGKGIGAALLEAGLADLLMSPARRMFLEVAEDNRLAIALYRRRGFSEIGRRKGYYPRPDGGPATALVMARNLG
jgi:[ribosomal protein S18]-alanine N-acetyltransferase